jgi:hypothetical protein
MNDYEILGVSPGATVSELKARWREFAMDLHPDYGGDPDEFIRVRDAYERLLVTAYHCRRCSDSGRVAIPYGFGVMYAVCTCKGGKDW